MISGTTYAASLLCRFLRFSIWFWRNVMATLLFLVNEGTERPLFFPADKNIAQPIQYTVRLAYYKQSYCKDIQIYLIFRTLEG